MADVRVGQKYPVRGPPVRQRMNLCIEVRGRIEQVRHATDAIDEAEARDSLGTPLARPNRRAQRLLTVEMWNPGVLRNAQDDELPVGSLWLCGDDTKRRDATSQDQSFSHHGHRPVYFIGHDQVAPIDARQ